jgi:hypothetical protein
LTQLLPQGQNNNSSTTSNNPIFNKPKGSAGLTELNPVLFNTTNNPGNNGPVKVHPVLPGGLNGVLGNLTNNPGNNGPSNGNNTGSTGGNTNGNNNTGSNGNTNGNTNGNNNNNTNTNTNTNNNNNTNTNTNTNTNINTNTNTNTNINTNTNTNKNINANTNTNTILNQNVIQNTIKINNQVNNIIESTSSAATTVTNISPTSRGPLVDLETVRLGKSTFPSAGIRPLADVAPFRIIGGHVSLNSPNPNVFVIVAQITDQGVQHAVILDLKKTANGIPGETLYHTDLGQEITGTNPFTGNVDRISHITDLLLYNNNRSAVQFNDDSQLTMTIIYR